MPSLLLTFEWTNPNVENIHSMLALELIAVSRVSIMSNTGASSWPIDFHHMSGATDSTVGEAQQNAKKDSFSLWYLSTLDTQVGES